MAAIGRPLDIIPIRQAWRAELHDGFVRLADGERHLDFHLVWLRDEVATSPAARVPDEVLVDDNVLRVKWRDGRVSRFPITWLLHNAYARDRSSNKPPPSNVESIEITAPAIGPETIRRAFAIVEQRGAVVVRRETKNAADETGQWHAQLAIADFRPVATSPLSPRAIELPAALPEDSNAEDVRHYQVLHARAPTTSLLLLADAHATLGYLASLDGDAARRLLVTPPRPESRPHLPFSEVESWFRARDLFASVIRDPRHHYRFRVKPGDLVIYDRRRMLYGQTEGNERALHALHVLGPDRTG